MKATKSPAPCNPEPIYRAMIAHDRNPYECEQLRHEAAGDLAAARVSGVASTIAFAEATLAKIDADLAAFEATCAPLDEAARLQAEAVFAHDAAHFLDAMGTVDATQAKTNADALIVARAARIARDVAHAAAQAASNTTFDAVHNSRSGHSWTARTAVMDETAKMAASLWSDDFYLTAFDLAKTQGEKADAAIERLWPCAEERARKIFLEREAEYVVAEKRLNKFRPNEQPVGRHASIQDLDQLFAARRAALESNRARARATLASFSTSEGSAS